MATREVRRMITEGASMDEIADYARRVQGMKDLAQSARELVLAGVTTLDELIKVTYSVD